MRRCACDLLIKRGADVKKRSGNADYGAAIDAAVVKGNLQVGNGLLIRARPAPHCVLLFRCHPRKPRRCPEQSP